MDDTIKMDKKNNIKKVINKKVGLLTSSHSYKPFQVPMGL